MSQYFNQPPNAPTGPAQRGTQAVLNTPSLIAMILGIVAVIMFGCAGFLGIPAIILGIVGVRGIGKSDGSQKGKGLALTGITLGIIATAIQVAMVIFYIKKAEDTPRGLFEEAELLIKSKTSDQIGFGNNETAEQMADSFGRKMKLLRSILFTGKDDSELSLTDGEFLTYCYLDDDSCVFMVHVPSLRKYQGKAQDSLADLAWKVAHGVLADNQFEDGTELAVGTKGVISYHRIDVGKFITDLDSATNRGIEQSDNDQQLLKAFFPKPKDESLNATDNSTLINPTQTN